MNADQRILTYCKRLREMRMEQNLTQRAVAAYLYVSTRTYCDYESGRIRIPVDRLIRLAQMYDVSLDYISGLTDVMRPFPGQ